MKIEPYRAPKHFIDLKKGDKVLLKRYQKKKMGFFKAYIEKYLGQYVTVVDISKGLIMTKELGVAAHAIRFQLLSYPPEE